MYLKVFYEPFIFSAVHRNALLLVSKSWRTLTLFLKDCFNPPNNLELTGMQLAVS